MLFLLMTYTGISVYNVNSNIKRKNKANKQIICKLSDAGYLIDENKSRNMCHNIVKMYNKEYYDDVTIGHFALSFIPILNVVTFYKNISSKEFLQGFYDCSIEKCLDKNILDNLKNNKVIKKEKTEVIKEFKTENRSIEELNIIREYIDEEIKVKQKIKTR